VTKFEIKPFIFISNKVSFSRHKNINLGQLIIFYVIALQKLCDESFAGRPEQMREDRRRLSQEGTRFTIALHQTRRNDERRTISSNYSVRRLIGSLWADTKAITITE
jgi:hypothetical protein